MTISYYVLLALLLGGNGFALSHMRRIHELERKLDLVLAHLGIDPSARVAPSSHVIDLAADPRKRIEAIKVYREQTGAGLKEAVVVVDEIAANTKGGAGA
jgi:ribosomal protein L7/L12